MSEQLALLPHLLAAHVRLTLSALAVGTMIAISQPMNHKGERATA